jgi:hypothetical protein
MCVSGTRISNTPSGQEISELLSTRYRRVHWRENPIKRIADFAGRSWRNWESWRDSPGIGWSDGEWVFRYVVIALKGE